MLTVHYIKHSVDRRSSDLYAGETDSSPGQFPPRTISLPCSVRVRVRSRVSRVRVRVKSVGLGLELVWLVLWLVLGLGLWFGLGECPGGEMSRVKFPTLIRRYHHE